MSNTHLTQALRFATGLFVAAGIITITFSSARLVSASLIGPGSSVVRVAMAGEPVWSHEGIICTGEPEFRTADRTIPAEQVRQTDSELQLIVGMLLVLAGFGFHALWVLRKPEVIVSPKRRRLQPKTGVIGSLHRVFRARLI